MEKSNLNVVFSIARFFAIFSIASAHTTISGPYWAVNLLSALGSVGVIVFIILSGYFYRPEKYKNIGTFYKSKLKSIVIPWIVMGTLVFLFSAIVNGTGIGAVKWAQWIIGYKTYLYYLTVLMICYLIFWKKSKAVMHISAVLTVASVLLTASGVLDGVIKRLYLTNYLNIFNWIGYFAIGYYIQDIKPEKIYDFIRKTRVISAVLFIGVTVIISLFKEYTGSGYFSYIGIPYQLLGALAITGISTIGFSDRKSVHTISNMTFGIYLLHMALVGICYKLCSYTLITKLLCPAVVVAVSAVILYIGYTAAKLVKLDKLYCTLTGIRMDRNIKK